MLESRENDWTRWGQLAAFVVSCSIGAALVHSGARHTQELTGAPRADTLLDIVPAVAAWKRSMANRNAPRIAFLGDSVLMGPPGAVTLDVATQWALDEREPELQIHALRFPGWSISGQYFLLDEIVDVSPDAVVVELNLRGLNLQSSRALGFTQLAGWTRSSRLWETAALPLSYAGLTLDRLLLYRAVVVADLEQHWMRLTEQQARLYKVREPLEEWLDASVGSSAYAERRLALTAEQMSKAFVPGAFRESRSRATRVLGDSLRGLDSDHAPLRVLGAMLDELETAGVSTLVWVAPVNVDHLRSLGIPLDGLARSIATLREIVEGSGARFLDTHALLRDHSFRDSEGHLTFLGDRNGTRLLADRLADAIRQWETAPHLALAPTGRRPADAFQ